jgi:hypothetical protein
VDGRKRAACLCCRGCVRVAVRGGWPAGMLVRVLMRWVVMLTCVCACACVQRGGDGAGGWRGHLARGDSAQVVEQIELGLFVRRRVKVRHRELHYLHDHLQNKSPPPRLHLNPNGRLMLDGHGKAGNTCFSWALRFERSTTWLESAFQLLHSWQILRISHATSEVA